MWRYSLGVGVVALMMNTLACANTFILYEADHRDRAEALAKALKVDVKFCAEVNSLRDGKAVDGLTMLTVWGHGGQQTFCGLDDNKFTDLIFAWKKLNPKLKAIEMLTCDARHNALDNRCDSYANRVVANVKQKDSKLEIKALPVGQSKGDSSILFANADTATYCYITAPNKETLDMAMKELLDLATKVNPQNNLAQAGNDLAKKKGTKKYSLVYGDLKGVQQRLVVVKDK